MICFVGRLQLVLCLVVSMANGLWAQEFRAPYPGTGRIPVTGNWRFHTSDDMAWASSTLDDSGWETITADTTWGAQTHPGHTGFAWYRRAFNIEGVTGPMSISMAPVDDIYELYWNGEHIGGRGIMPPHAKWSNRPKPEVFALPKAGPDGKLQGVLAIRVWKSPLASLDPNTLGGMNGAPSVGDSKVLLDGLPDAEFAVSRFHLAEEDEVTLYTDGVLEAMRTDGEMFGFARAREMMRSRPSAQVVAETARSFGQKDDITIVKIVRVHAEDTRDRMSVNLQMAKAGART